MRIALTAYSCRDSLGLDGHAIVTAFPFKPLSRHRRDHICSIGRSGRLESLVICNKPQVVAWDQAVS